MQARRIASLTPVDLLNELNRDLAFTPMEWRWLAKRYGLTLTDLNAERRRYGKYGPPGSKPVKPQPSAGVEMPPAAPPPAGKALEPVGAPAPVFDVKPAEPPAAPAASAPPAAEPPPASPALRRAKDK
jgi:hypothetical protein